MCSITWADHLMDMASFMASTTDILGQITYFKMNTFPQGMLIARQLKSIFWPDGDGADKSVKFFPSYLHPKYFQFLIGATCTGHTDRIYTAKCDIWGLVRYRDRSKLQTLKGCISGPVCRTDMKFCTLVSLLLVNKFASRTHKLRLLRFSAIFNFVKNIKKPTPPTKIDQSSWDLVHTI